MAGENIKLFSILRVRMYQYYIYIYICSLFLLQICKCNYIQGKYLFAIKYRYALQERIKNITMGERKEDVRRLIHKEIHPLGRSPALESLFQRYNSNFLAEEFQSVCSGIHYKIFYTNENNTYIYKRSSREV